MVLLCCELAHMGWSISTLGEFSAKWEAVSAHKPDKGPGNRVRKDTVKAPVKI